MTEKGNPSASGPRGNQNIQAGEPTASIPEIPSPRGLEFALALATRGYRVFPVQGKTPLVKDWPNKASSDPGFILDMWMEHPDAAIGIACGDPVLAVDLDVKTTDGIVNWKQWCKDNNVDGETRHQETPSGGAHILYTMPEGIKLGNGTGDLPPGIDIRGNGGYIVAYGMLPAVSELPTLPKALETTLKPRQKPERAQGDVIPRDPALGIHPYASRAIGYELARLDECARGGDLWDSTTFAVACNLIEFANSSWSAYSLEQALEDFLGHAPRDPGFGPPEHWAKWDSALQKVGDMDRPEPEDNQSSPEDVFSVEEDEPTSTRFPRLDFDTLLDPNRPEREWVVRGLIPVGASVSIVGPPGSMKSLITFALAMAVARGDKTFAELPIRPRRVCYVDMENTEDDISERITNLRVKPAELGNLVYLHLPALPPLDTAEGGAAMKEIIDAYAIATGDLLVLDSAQRVIEGPEDKSDTYRAFYRHTGLMLKQRGITVVRLDNSGKDVTKGARGSSSKRDDVDIELLMIRDGDIVDIKLGSKTRISHVTDVRLRKVENEDTGELSFTTAGDIHREHVNEAKKLLDGLGVPPITGMDSCWKTLQGANHLHLPRAAVRDAVRERKPAFGGAK